MSKNNKIKKVKWYDNGEILTSIILGIITLIVICSQGLANGQLSFAFFSSVINHNSIFILVFVYFAFLKFDFGKKYFNYLNIVLIFLYFLTTITSLLTVIQSFSLTTVLSFVLNLFFLIYLSHTLFRDTIIWKDYHLSASPFNELTNEWFFYTILVVAVLSLAVDLISTVEIDGVIISFLDAVYYGLFARYIYLYREYLDAKKLDSNNSGNFDEVREKVQEVLDKTEIDEKIIEAKDKVVDVSKDVKKKVDDFIEDNEIDKKIDETSRNIKKSIDDFVDKNELDKKAEKVKKDIEKEFKGTKKKRTSTKKGDK